MEKEKGILKSNLVNELDPEKIYSETNNLITDILWSSDHIDDKNLERSIYSSSVLYMTYWYHRLKNKPEERNQIFISLAQYFWFDWEEQHNKLREFLLNPKLIMYAEKNILSLVPKRTVDIFIRRESQNWYDVLCWERNIYPVWNALPWGFILDEDNDNPLWIDDYLFAALRIGWQKILWWGELTYGQETDNQNKHYYYVRNDDTWESLQLYFENFEWYRYKDHLKSILFPSDPRHMVDTIWIELKYQWNNQEKNGLFWKSKTEIMDEKNQKWWFVFWHHREIVSHLISRTSVEKERNFLHHEWIKSIIENPFELYQELEKRFSENNYNPETSFPELFPIIDRIKDKLFSDEINEICRHQPILLWLRDKVVISLRHVSLKNRIFCPYRSTLQAIFKAISLFDIIAREKKWFYNDLESDKIIEHNPKNIAFASYHMYRYEYRLNEVMNLLPHEIILPTFESLWATDLMKVRWVPIRFIGLSFDFLYVDEFEQSPEEFLMHDINHSFRMIMEDRKMQDQLQLSPEKYYRQTSNFIKEYLERIRIKTTDTKEQKEIKKLQKMILFEILHEDARPALKEIIIKYIQVKEGWAVAFELPRIDKNTWYMDIVDVMDTGISTLSYVRNKLQHWFYDKVDSQITQIVSPEYRTSHYIALAAQKMLWDLWIQDVSFNWLLERTVSFWPDNIHESIIQENFGDINPDPGVNMVNPKRYQI